MGDATPIYLDPEDEITSAIVRLRRSGAARVVVVLPPGSRIGTSRINFRLLAREAEAAGKSLEIVSPDAAARAIAAAAGLDARPSLLRGPQPGATPDPGSALPPAPPAVPPTPVPVADVPTEATAVRRVGLRETPSRIREGSGATDTAPIAVPRESAPVPRVGTPRRVVSTRVAAIAALVAVVLVAGGAYAAFALLPSATITLVPGSQTIGPLDLVVTAETGITAPDPANLLIPAQRVTYDVSVSKTFNATGVKVTETKASGSVRVQNCNTGGSLLVVKGTGVSTDAGVVFRTTVAITVPRAKVNPFTCSTLDAPIVADVAGPAGNVGAGAITTIVGNPDPTIYSVTNVAATSGGTHTEAPQVSQKDVDAAMASLKTDLATAATTKLGEVTAAAGAATTFPESVKLTDPTPSVDPATLVGQAVTTFDLGLAQQGSVLQADPAPVTALAEARLQARVPEGWSIVDGSVRLVRGQAEVVGDSVTYPVTASATRVQAVDGPALLKRVLGLDLPAARAVLDDYGKVTIAVWPDWVTTVPTNGRTTLTVESPAPSAAPSESSDAGTGASPAPDGSTAP